MENDKPFDLELFIKSSDAGFYQIAINICSYLDLQGMKRMREVNKTIKKFMDHERLYADLLIKPILHRPENLNSYYSEEFERWVGFINVMKKFGTFSEIFTIIPINRKYACIGEENLPLSPLKVAIVIESKRLVMMLRKYGLLNNEEKCESFFSIRGNMEFVNKAWRWVSKDEEVYVLLTEKSSNEVFTYLTFIMGQFQTFHTVSQNEFE